ncbi:MAG: SDR family NAD(P)-dependent oxidoreductase [Dehalococcoidia bacterium]|jgi:NAD(P)-dependent dehydrogenase (short-subunit alcohol dehydrogenase family)|nr:short-chain dehydrogenase [Chloroflexota bacterium]MDP6057043.1 SDR family NAD(P)-dependent oxidoreductase [Dehalococcoidia bacterium]MDP7261234.1 SDR family NAD(P)-dependent oxidoreductase [Dehalococcoidia bacterium]|tara:strand:+ start:4471 stop:5307 length:837 start_codon:yes stop_codon:yes gene_type:complete
MGKLDGKVAIVTGAARGHSEAVARRFAREGTAVAICDIVPVEALEAQVGSKIRQEGGRVICFQTDVSDEDQVNAMVEETLAQFGTIDILANVVGIAGPTKDVWDMSLAEWKQTLDVNLDSLFLCCKAVLPVMVENHYGKIINFSSATGKQPLSHRAPYATSKMGVIGFTRTLAADVGQHNINVNAICPGEHELRSLELAQGRAEYQGKPFDKNEFHQNYVQRRHSEKAVLAGRWRADEGFTDQSSGSEDAAALALYLASDDSASMTGQDINTSGGVMW